jgi:hypothetical protein
VTLRQASRTARHIHDTDHVGEETAEDLMTHLTSLDADQLATKADLAELRADFSELRADVRSDIAQQTKWLATLVFAALGLGMPVSVGVIALVS